MTGVSITFQGPSFAAVSDRRALDQAYGWQISVAGFDLDYGAITVYTNFDDGMNHVLAERCRYVNENGDDCGAIGWRIRPSDDLLKSLAEDQRTSLERAIGWEFGRVIVTAGGFAVDIQPDPSQARLDRVVEEFGIDDSYLATVQSERNFVAVGTAIVDGEHNAAAVLATLADAVEWLETLHDNSNPREPALVVDLHTGARWIPVQQVAVTLQPDGAAD